MNAARPGFSSRCSTSLALSAEKIAPRSRSSLSCRSHITTSGLTQSSNTKASATLVIGTLEPLEVLTKRPAYSCCSLVDAVDAQPIGEALATQEHAQRVALAGAAGAVPAHVPVLVPRRRLGERHRCRGRDAEG